MEYWHLSITSRCRTAAFPDDDSRRCAVRAIDRSAGDAAFLFDVLPHRVEVAFLREAGGAGHLTNAVRRALAHESAEPLEPPHRRPVESRAHLLWLVRHVLRACTDQSPDVHPAAWSGSCAQDLLGVRRLPRFRPRLREILPRLRLRDIHEIVALPPAALVPASPADVRRGGAARLVRAAAAALCISSDLPARAAPVVAARRAAARLGTEAGIPTRELAWALAVPGRTVRRLATERVDPSLTRAVLLRISLEELVGVPAIGA